MAKKKSQINIVINPRTLIMSEFFTVFSIIDLKDFGVNNNGKPITNIKNAVQSKSNFGNATMKIYSKKVKSTYGFT